MSSGDLRQVIKEGNFYFDIVSSGNKEMIRDAPDNLYLELRKPSLKVGYK